MRHHPTKDRWLQRERYADSLQLGGKAWILTLFQIVHILYLFFYIFCSFKQKNYKSFKSITMTEYILETDSNLNWKHEPPATSTELHAILSLHPSVACHRCSRAVLLLCVFWCMCPLSSVRLQHPAACPWLPLHSYKCSRRRSICLIKYFECLNHTESSTINVEGDKICCRSAIIRGW